MSKRILVVDDDIMNLRMAEFILSREGYDVHKEESGMDCLSYLKKHKPDLILLDVQMPVLNGIKTFEIIKENKEMAKIPVIFLTANSEIDTVVEACRLGVADYVKKPFLPEDLVKRVEKVFDRA